MEVSICMCKSGKMMEHGQETKEMQSQSYRAMSLY